ncbi:hypothetical protein CA603_31515 [Paraburkholderia hospita]|nr:hypothetical protein CA603_31515 [Paraburkholderia hospita]
MTCGPWSQEQIDEARMVLFSAVLDHLGAFHKLDRDYEPLDPGRRSKRVHVGYQGRDFRFIFTGPKFVNQLLPEGAANRGGGGAIDSVRHVTGCNFVHAVKVCLDALAEQRSR